MNPQDQNQPNPSVVPPAMTPEQLQATTAQLSAQGMVPTNNQAAGVPIQQQVPMIQQPGMSAPTPQLNFQPPMPGQYPSAIPPEAIAQQPANPNAPQMISTGQMAAAAAPPQVVENPLSTQATLMFSELRDGIVIMKDGSFRAVIACQSINFDLMSEQEREGVEYSYQNFLNSLNFTTQILVRSQKVDIGPYIERLINLRRNNDNMLLGVLMDDYINFIDELSREANIMDKSFFIIVPYYSSPDMEQTIQQTKNFFKALSKNKGQTVTRINRDVYNKAIEELNNRTEAIVSGLFQIGIHSVRLNTKELSQLFYNFNNPDTAVREPLVDFSQMATLYVKKGTKEQ